MIQPQREQHTDELYWEVKASHALTGGIGTSWGVHGTGNGWSNSDWVMNNIGTMTENQEYEIFFRFKK